MTEMSAAEAATMARFENAEPAPESWGGGLREALAEALFQVDISRGSGGLSGMSYGALAGAVLALPEIAALRAKAAAADRVRDELDALSRETGAFEAGYKGWALKVVSAVRRALDGPDRTDRGRC